MKELTKKKYFGNFKKDFINKKNHLSFIIEFERLSNEILFQCETLKTQYDYVINQCKTIQSHIVQHFQGVSKVYEKFQELESRLEKLEKTKKVKKQ